MKKLQLLIVALVAYVAMAIGFVLGRQHEAEYYSLAYSEAYKAACLMSDVIRCYQDNLEDTTLGSNDLGLFEEIKGVYLDDEGIDINQYSWAY